MDGDEEYEAFLDSINREIEMDMQVIINIFKHKNFNIHSPTLYAPVYVLVLLNLFSLTSYFPRLVSSL